MPRWHAFHAYFAAIAVALPACGAILDIKPLEVETASTAADGGGGGGGGSSTTPGDKDSGSSTIDAAPRIPPTRPPEGVYTYTTSGFDKLSGSFQSTRNYGPTAKITVKHQDGNCFTMEFEIRDGYKDMIRLCLDGLDFVQRGADAGSRYQTFIFGASASTVQECNPGDVYFTSNAALDQNFPHDCTGTNVDDRDESSDSAFQTKGTYVYKGEETIVVGPNDVKVMHFRDDRKVTKAQTGDNKADWRWNIKNSVLVGLNREIDIDYKFGAFDIHYAERLNMTLTTAPDGGL